MCVTCLCRQEASFKSPSFRMQFQAFFWVFSASQLNSRYFIQYEGDAFLVRWRHASLQCLAAIKECQGLLEIVLAISPFPEAYQSCRGDFCIERLTQVLERLVSRRGIARNKSHKSQISPVEAQPAGKWCSPFRAAEQLVENVVSADARERIGYRFQRSLRLRAPVGAEEVKNRVLSENQVVLGKRGAKTVGAVEFSEGNPVGEPFPQSSVQYHCITVSRHHFGRQIAAGEDATQCLPAWATNHTTHIGSASRRCASLRQCFRPGSTQRRQK